MKHLLESFLATYLDGEKVDNKEKEYHKILCQYLPQQIRTIVMDNKYKIKGSCGASNKAEIPWIGIFNQKITTTAQKGIYIVYLFKSDMSGFYLCLGQGVTNFEKYGKNKIKYMTKVAEYFKSLTETSVFSKAGIDLKARTQIGKDYAKVNVLSKYYDKNNINSYNFEEDLEELIKIYEQIYEDMNFLSYDKIIDNILADEKDVALKDAVKIIKTAVSVEEINANKEKLIEIDVPNIKKRIYKNISKEKVSKIDYISKSKKDVKNGLVGEKLAMQYELEKMKTNNRLDLIDKIDWVSSYDDARGYDILSYDFDENGNEYNIYIEVKTTENSENSSFFISANEIEKMKENTKEYWIYRVSNLNDEPKLYKVNGEMFFNKFELEPYTYVANLRSEE